MGLAKITQEQYDKNAALLLKGGHTAESAKKWFDSTFDTSGLTPSPLLNGNVAISSTKSNISTAPGNLGLDSATLQGMVKAAQPGLLATDTSSNPRYNDPMKAAGTLFLSNGDVTDSKWGGLGNFSSTLGNGLTLKAAKSNHTNSEMYGGKLGLGVFDAAGNQVGLTDYSTAGMADLFRRTGAGEQAFLDFAKANGLAVSARDLLTVRGEAGGSNNQPVFNTQNGMVGSGAIEPPRGNDAAGSQVGGQGGAGSQVGGQGGAGSQVGGQGGAGLLGSVAQGMPGSVREALIRRVNENANERGLLNSSITQGAITDALSQGELDWTRRGDQVDQFSRSLNLQASQFSRSLDLQASQFNQSLGLDRDKWQQGMAFDKKKWGDSLALDRERLKATIDTAAKQYGLDQSKLDLSRLQIGQNFLSDYANRIYGIMTSNMPAADKESAIANMNAIYGGGAI
ncbi:hypothetical protein [Chitinilyticum litopenaei]|uniref:hypothetical protein n=1 Tax=Chitinilyticum litopenaei TaxID=1121276 RepID=UPI0004014EA2|nr:hypothetical protein [Chitinilyticum litopenaei]